MRLANELGRKVALAALLLSAASGLSGCNLVGALSLFNYQFVDPLIPEPVVQAQYKLPAGRVAVIVEADEDLEISSPKLPSLVAKRLTDKLTEHVSDREVVSHETVAALSRQLRGRFRRLSNDELGRRLSADTLIRVELTDYRAGTPSEGDQRLGQVEALIRVLDASEEDKVLWPQGQPAFALSVRAEPYDPANTSFNDYKIMDVLAESVADKTSKLFYDFRPPKRDIGDRPD